MDVFGLRNRLIQDYSDYIQSFINIKDARVREYVEDNLTKGFLWPDPLIQMNPAFEAGEWIDELVDQGILHEECSRIFRIKADKDDNGNPLRLHRHQTDAIKAAKTNKNYILTTGTGSGKSLAYIIPIVDHVLNIGSGKGVQAIIVYPMNALCNSQYGELEKFLCYGYPKDHEPVRFARYTGQERDEQRQEIIANPPDIILTNYVMLELILTRPSEKNMIAAARGLRYLVLDELHTYRGRQGADVALLTRRLRNACQTVDLQCIGTSATLAGPGSYEEQRREISDVATKLFGSPVLPEMIIGETLRRATREMDLNDPSFIKQLKDRVGDPAQQPSQNYEDFIQDPLSIWIENTFGVTTEKEFHRLIRTTPISVTGENGAAARLSEISQVKEEQCVAAIQKGLMAGYQCLDPDTRFPVFAFRLHQFISRGDNVYASLDPIEPRHITVHGQQYVPGDRERILLPTVFCRECGQEYYSVRVFQDPKSNQKIFEPRDLGDRFNDDESEAGFLYSNPERSWPEDPEEIIERVPDEWLEEFKGNLRLKKHYRKYLPQRIRLSPNGKGSDKGETYTYLKAPFRICLNCGVAYGARQLSDIGKLASLGTEGRSTATTILSLAAVRHLHKEETLKPEARKLLSFTDNRQDASLQAGHLNDFIEIGLLRSALFKAVETAGPEGLSHDVLTLRVFDALNLAWELYAQDPSVKPRYGVKEETDKALRNMLGYRLYHDLRRGWRVTAPNLEQCGLLKIGYAFLKELCEDDQEWQKRHPALVSATPETRYTVCKVLLDYMRRSLAMKVDYLNPQYQEQMRLQSNQRLGAPWAIDENETLVTSAILFPRSGRRTDYGGHVFLSPRGLFGQYLRRPSTFPDHDQKMTLDMTLELIQQILELMRLAGLVDRVMEAKEPDDVPGYQMPAAALRWFSGDGTNPFHDPLRVTIMSEFERRANPFFISYYRDIATEGKGIQAKEHTAQVSYEDRKEREDRFREGHLPVLYCSPTMELGIDIATLNVVNMRNIPPTPANYAQRSGRAGRSGQPALVFSYCSTGSPHDQHFFKHPELMVSGAVSPPKLDLSNEDLVQAHVHSIWLACTGQSLGTSLRDILDVGGDNPTLALQPSVLEALQSHTARKKGLLNAQAVLASIEKDLESADWYSQGWVEDVLNKVNLSFENACDRWRSLYRAAMNQRDVQHKIANDFSRKAQDRNLAKRLRAEAEAQIQLLLESSSVVQSDFYSYRYFASEGFLPGYNFPRLPLSAYVPGRGARRKSRDNFLSRPRFLAISEFGPRSILYHEGSRYLINKVIMPVADSTQDDSVLTTLAKLCPRCGYLHPVPNNGGADLCEHCGAPLDPPLRQLFRLQNVSTRRRDRINCDEEERLRMGYEIKTGVRFAVHGGKPSFRTASIMSQEGEELGTLTYAHAATIWRINLGWTRRKNQGQYGFMLDIERGYWSRNEQAEEESEGDPLSARVERVIPYVEDRKNCLLFQASSSLDEIQMASLQAALKQAIQTCYQLEDKELAAEPLPDRDARKAILFYEASEGGAGVLRQLINDQKGFSDIIRAALEICHFDSDTGEDKRRATGAVEDCEAACYDCMMSYGNQRDHSLLDRQAIHGLLMKLKSARVSASPVGLPRAEHLRRLMNQAGSELEREWLRFLDDRDLHLPTKAQVFIESCKTRPDFIYEEAYTVIYVDGPVHKFPDRQDRDQAQSDCLEDLGYSVIRFSHQDDWQKVVSTFPNVFGLKKG